MVTYDNIHEHMNAPKYKIGDIVYYFGGDPIELEDSSGSFKLGPVGISKDRVTGIMIAQELGRGSPNDVFDPNGWIYRIGNIYDFKISKKHDELMSWEYEINLFTNLEEMKNIIALAYQSTKLEDL